MTTVGYGDLSPATPEVRMVAMIVIVTGVFATALITAALAGRVAEIRIERKKISAQDTYTLEDDIEKIQAQFCEMLDDIRTRTSTPKVKQALFADQEERRLEERRREREERKSTNQEVNHEEDR
jgi:hypothetical protein